MQGVWQKEVDHFFPFGHLSVTFSHASVTFLVTFFPRLLLPDSFCGRVNLIGRRVKTPTPKTRFSTWTLLRTPGRCTTRPLPVHFTTKMSVVRPFSVLRLTFFHADFGKEFPSRTLWRDPSRNCPSPSSAVCPLLYRTDHFSRGENGENVPRKGEEDGVASKGGKKEKRTRENRSE